MSEEKQTLTTKDRQWIAWLIAVVLIVMTGFLGVKFPALPPTPQDDPAMAARGITHFTQLDISAPTAQATDEPALVIDTDGVGLVLDIRDAGTPVFSVDDGGAVTQVGAGAYTGGQTFNNWVVASAPTAIATATPAFIIDSAGVSKILSVRDSGTEILSVDSRSQVGIAAPTTIATGVPALRINSDGVSKIISIRDGGTEVLGVNDGGQIVIAVPTALATGVPGLVVDSSALGKVISIRDGGTEILGVNHGGQVVASAPTAIATGVPGSIIDNAGVSEILELRYGGTEEYAFNSSRLELNANYLDQDISTENIMLPTTASTAFTYTAAAGGTIPVFTVADGQIWFVHAIFINVTTDFDCTGDDCTLELGDGTDTDGFCVLADAEMQTADTEQTGSPAGWQCLVAATMGVFLDGAVSSAPHVYAPSGAAETIDIILDEGSGETYAAGAGTAYIVYTRIQ